MKKFLIASMGLVAAVVLAASISSAQSITAWDVSGHGSPSDSSLAPATSDANVAFIPSLTRFGVGASAAGNSFSASNWNASATSVDVNNDYFTFTVQANGGYQLNLTSLSFNMCGSNTAPNQDAWGYSINGGAWTIQPTFHMTLASPGMQTWDFADFTTQGTVEFRFWAWGTTEINGATPSVVGGTTRIANIAGPDLILGGTITVPEPSTIALIGFGLVGMLAFGRRRFSRS
jgi:hypothetical protein